jgi:hypothetical protein
MKRIITLVLAGQLLLGAVGGPAQARPDTSLRDTHGRACVDVIGGDAVYDEVGLGLRLQLAGTSCRRVTYTLIVLDQAGTELSRTSVTGTGTASTVEIDAVAADYPETVCMVATTTIGRRLLDRAPDDGCVEITFNGPVGGSRSFR